LGVLGVFQNVVLGIPAVGCHIFVYQR